MTQNNCRKRFVRKDVILVLFVACFLPVLRSSHDQLGNGHINLALKHLATGVSVILQNYASTHSCANVQNDVKFIFNYLLKELVQDALKISMNAISQNVHDAKLRRHTNATESRVQ